MSSGAGRRGRVSPASNGGRGLKHLRNLAQAHDETVSPASNGGRGLKRIDAQHVGVLVGGIARQQWRARIETVKRRAGGELGAGIARQQWRARIETPACTTRASASSGIARQQWRARIETG